MVAMPISPEQTLMHREVHEAAAAVARQLQANDPAVSRLVERLQARPPGFIVTVARGSSDHAATFAKYVFETQVGLITASASPSVSSLYAAQPRLDGALYIAISQSGASPDLVRHAQAAKAAGALVVAMVNVEDSPLAIGADVVLPLHAGPERSVAATKSFVCSLSAILHLAARWKRDPQLLAAVQALPTALDAAWSLDWSPMVDGLVTAQNLFVVGRGLGLAAAQEAALKLKETCGLHAEAFSAAEVKHGPMVLVGPGFPVLFFAQRDESWDGTLALAREFRERGARVWIAAPGDSVPDALPVSATLASICTPVATMVSFYRAANALSLRRGRNPDLPPHLNKVTRTL